MLPLSVVRIVAPRPAPPLSTSPQAAAAPKGAGAFIAAMAPLFLASAAATIWWSRAMEAMGGTPMAGGWRASMAWLPMCGQDWGEVAAGFVAMWVLMVAAMMLPAIAPVLWRRHRVTPATPLTAITATGYLAVWVGLGIALFSGGAALMQAALLWPALARTMPLMGGIVMLLAGAWQCGAGKRRALAQCRCIGAPIRRDAMSAAQQAWRDGVQLGMRCSRNCAGYTAALLVMGVMDWRVMLLITAVIVAERWLPLGERIAQTAGIAAMAGGAWLILCALARL